MDAEANRLFETLTTLQRVQVEECFAVELNMLVGDHAAAVEHATNAAKAAYLSGRITERLRTREKR